MHKKIVVVSAAALLAASVFAARAQTPQAGEGPGAVTSRDCKGVNACKGQSACRSANNACKGQNACKGKGWITVGSAFECDVLKQK